MSFAALAVTAILVLAPAAVTTGGEAPAATARATHVKIYDIEDLAGNEVPILNHSMVTGVQVEGEKPPPPDWENVAALDASRTLDRFCSLIQSRAGSSSRIRLVDVGLTDEDFQEYFDSSDPVAVRKRAREVRSSLSHTLGPVFPGMDVSRSLLVDTDSSGHRRIDVDLRAVRRQREERLKADTGLMAASEAFCRIVDTIFPPGWYLPKTTADPPIVQAQLPATLPTANGRRFAIIWLPEVRHPGPVLNHKPIAVATDGTCSLIATTGWIRWRPDIRPAAIALFLRQHLDRGEFRGPLTHEHWLAAAQFILSDKTAELDRDLAELLSFHK